MVLSLALFKMGSCQILFKIKTGMQTNDPISLYIFILCAEILEKMIRSGRTIKGINIYGKEFKFSQYADGRLIKEGLEILNSFYIMSSLSSLLFLLSVFILWFSYYVSDIFCKF